MQIRPPPEPLTEWVQFIAIQLAAAGALAIAGWKLLTKPFTKRDRILARRVRRMRRVLRTESVDWRTKMQTVMGGVEENARTIESNSRRIDGVEQRIEHLEEEMRQCFGGVQEGIDKLLRYAEGKSQDDKREGT